MSRAANGSTSREYFAEGEFVPGSSSQSYFYGIDQVGSVRRAFLSATSASASAFDPYGSILQSPLSTDFGYAGLLYDAGIGLNFATYRAYNPTMSRWLSRDPLGEQSDRSANLYAYVAGRPVVFSDKFGLQGGEAEPPEGIPDETPQEEMYPPIGPDSLQQPTPPPEPATSKECTVPHPFGIPPNYIATPTRGPGGTQYTDPNNPYNFIRVMPGNPNSSNPAQQVPYVKDLRNGQSIDENGNPVSGKDPAAHIPQASYRFR